MSDEPVAELGPWLGRLPEVARRDRDPDFALDPVRFALVTSLFERAHVARRGRAGSAAVEGVGLLDGAAWLATWREAVEDVTRRTLAVIDERLARAGQRSGAPARRRLAARPAADERAMIQARLDAAGAGFERELARTVARTDEWPAAIRRLAAALEEAWDELERSARAEVATYDPAVSSLEQWRPPRVLWFGAAAGLAGLALWLGLTLGGLLPRPRWLDPFVAWFWSLPWP